MGNEEQMPSVPELPRIAVPAPVPPGAAPAPPAAPELVPAGFWVRGGALIFDGLLVGLPLKLMLSGLPYSDLAGMGCGAAYHTLMVGSYGQTLGKMMAGVTVVCPDGGRVGYSRAFARALLNMFSAVLLCLGYLVAVFNPGRRALHDYLADTRVVYLEPVGRARKALAALFPALVPFLAIAGAIALFAFPRFGLPLFNRYCEEGNAKACSYAATIYNYNGKYRNVFLALSNYERACKGGYAPACAKADKLRASGISVQQPPGGAEAAEK